ncbi:MAG: RES family NAD+ phosphorylase [Candidatus Binatia bacterium]
MTSDFASCARALATVATIAVHTRLIRVVPALDLGRRVPPNFLFTSGRPNRFNPAGVECVYFAEDEATAVAEYLSRWRGTRAENQPRTTYCADVTLRRVLDLTDRQVVSHMGLAAADLCAPWRGASTPTATQVLGQAVAHQYRVSAIRYPSVSTGRAASGTNIVVYRDSVRAPDQLRILGPTRRALQHWP